MTIQLGSKASAAQLIAKLSGNTGSFGIAVNEDLCFGIDNWVNIGNISLFTTAPQIGSQKIYGEPAYTIERAIEFGGYEWQLPTDDNLNQNVIQATDDLAELPQKKICKSFIQGLQDVVRRSLLLYSVFDPYAMAKMPFNRPTTIVPDTSSIHQGALNFVYKFLTPAARIKIPAIVHMEILMQVDNYFSGIRWKPENKGKPGYRTAALREHLLSQGGQRTLLRLEIEPDAELERGDLGADPLRGIISPSSDQEDKALGLSIVTRSFADRLIVETARHFRSHVRPDHPLALLTSDQGMARMAMSEGIEVVYFQARSSPLLSGKTLTGALFHPFEDRIFTVPLTDVLWELAVSFGSVRLSNVQKDRYIELTALGGDGDLVWQTDHIRNDMLWIKHDGIVSPSDIISTPVSIDLAPVGTDNILEDDQVWSNENSALSAETVTVEADPLVANAPQFSETSIGWYKFTPNKMAQLINVLMEKRALLKDDIKIELGIKTDNEIRRYIKFLESGGYISLNGNLVTATDYLRGFWAALQSGDAEGFLDVLLAVPSFDLLHHYVMQQKIIEYSDPELPVSDFAKSTYIAIGVAAWAWLLIGNNVVVKTDARPTTKEFAVMALNVFQELASDNQTEHVLTGLWLEKLAENYSVHPCLSKQLLSEAVASGIVQANFEGSTPDTRFDTHTMFLLKPVEQIQHFEKVFLYRGDFLISGTSSIRLKLEGLSNAT